jgi:hypothetical protein
MKRSGSGREGADFGWEGSRPSVPDLPQPEVLEINYMFPKASDYHINFCWSGGDKETNWKYPASQSPNSSATPAEVAPSPPSSISAVAAKRWCTSRVSSM